MTRPRKQFFTTINQKQPPEVFYEKAVLRNFAIFTGKHLWKTRETSGKFQLESLLKRLQHATLSKRDSNTQLYQKETSTRNFIKKRLQHATLSKRDFNTQLYQKETPTQGVFLWILRNFKEHLFWRTFLSDSFWTILWNTCKEFNQTTDGWILLYSLIS